jgi:Protein of unknown function (DUF2950)
MIKSPISAIAVLLLTCAGAVVILSQPSIGSAAGQKSFPTAEAAARALLTAAQTNDIASLNLLFGDQGKEIVTSGDPVQDKNRRDLFVDLARRSLKVEPDPKDPSRFLILIGDDDFPFPVPLVKTGTEWKFDTVDGKRELLARRIGANELDAIDLCHKYVDAQYDFAAQDNDGSGVHQYAQRFISSPNKKDGLYWPAEEGSPTNPIADLVTQAAAEGYDTTGDKPVPYHGYYFHILTGEGPLAKGGQKDYLTHGLMIGGFGLVAWPVEYGVSGVKSFLVNQMGTVYEKDMGSKTPVLAKAIRTFNPDSAWKAVK